MVNCTKCNKVLCYESDILTRIENDDYDEIIDGGYCFDIKCDNCGHVNDVFATMETSVSYIRVE